MAFEIGCVVSFPRFLIAFTCLICQNEYAIQVKKEIGYDWTAGEESVSVSSEILFFLFIHHDFYIAYGQ
jgi:hypothetical protein